MRKLIEVVIVAGVFALNVGMFFVGDPRTEIIPRGRIIYAGLWAKCLIIYCTIQAVTNTVKFTVDEH